VRACTAARPPRPIIKRTNARHARARRRRRILPLPQSQLSVDSLDRHDRALIDNTVRDAAPRPTAPAVARANARTAEKTREADPCSDFRSAEKAFLRRDVRVNPEEHFCAFLGPLVSAVMKCFFRLPRPSPFASIGGHCGANFPAWLYRPHRHSPIQSGGHRRRGK